LGRRGVPVLGEAPDAQRLASLVLSEDTTSLSDRSGKAFIAFEKQIDEQTAFSGRGGAPGMFPSDRGYRCHL